MGTDIVRRLKLKTTWPLHLMLVVPIVLLVIFCYLPMVGIVISFQNFLPTKGFFGSKWVGLAHYQFVFGLEDTMKVIRNTVVISTGKIICGIVFSIFIAILLNEVPARHVRKTIQTFVFFPFFVSWVILGGVMVDLLSLKGGINQLVASLGMKPRMFLGDNSLFVPVVIITNTWKDFGYNLVLFYAAIMNVDPALYEAAAIDGAGRMRQTISVTLPAMMPIIAVVSLLSLGGVLNGGFDQIFNLYNILVYETGDILDTYIYRLGLLSGQYSFATAIGLFKSVVGMVLIVISYWAADRFAGYRIM